MSELTLKWNGQSWEVSGVPESMQVRRDSIFTVEASESAFELAAPSASEAVTDLSTLSLEELRKINSDYLPESRTKLESVILNPGYLS